MKKFFAAILALLYLSTSIGVTVHMHYCMGKLADWSLGHKESKVCNGCGMEKDNGEDNGCCKDEHKFVKNNPDQKVVESSFQLMEVMGTAFLPEYAELPFIQTASATEEYPVSNAPPRSSSIAVYILNRTFLI
jgi:hypothetical protein